jgi:hypothetical protein
MRGFKSRPLHSPRIPKTLTPIPTGMEQSELYEAWQRNKDSPQFARNYSEELRAYLSDGVTSGMPSPDASTFQWRQWLEAKRGVVTRQLNPENGGDSSNSDADKEDT